MIKNLNQIDEIVEQHKFKKSNLNKTVEKKHNNKSKLINPKFIFEKKPKNTKGNFRSPENNKKGPPILEDLI